MKKLLLASLCVPWLCLAADAFPPIGQLETRDYVVIVHASPDGRLYTVKTHDGEIVEHQLPEQLLATLFPQLYQTFQRGIANPPDARPATASKDSLQ